jgi:MFS family permease
MLTAALSLVYFIAYYVIYRDPSQDTKLHRAELAYIHAGHAMTEGASDVDSISLLKYLLVNRKVWGLTIGFAAYGFTFYLFLTWLPGYLVETMHMDIIKSSFFTTVPWSFATATDLLIGGLMVDTLIKRGYSENKVRKTVLIVGMLFGLAVFGATQTSDPIWAIVWITIALSGLAFAAPVGWSIPALIAPKGGSGTIGGIMNFVNNVMAIVAPIATGYIVVATHSFTAAFYIAGAVLVIGILSFTLVLGRLEPIPSPR